MKRMLTILGLSLGILAVSTGAFAQAKQHLEPSAWTISFVVVYVIICMALGIWATKWAKTPEQFFGSTKTFGPITIGLASMAAVMSAFGFIGGPGFVYAFGFSSIWMTIACGPGFAFAYWTIGKRMRAMAEVTSVATLPDIAHIRFKSQAIRGLLSLSLFIAAIAYLSSQVKGGAKLLVQMLGVTEPWAIVILFGVTMAYMMFGGMSSHIVTNAFQGLVMLFGVLAVVFGFFTVTGGDAMTVIQDAATHGPKFIDGAGTLPLHFLITFALIFFIGVLGQPQLLTKMYTLKDYKGLKMAGVIGGVTYGMSSIVWILAGYGAMYIVASGGAPALGDKDEAAFLFLSRLSPLIQATVMAALMAAIMSTADFFISIAASSITRDIPGAFGKEVSLDAQVNLGRIMTFVATLFAVGFGYWGGDTVLVLGTLGWGFFASATFPTFLIGMLWKRTSKEGVIAGLAICIIANIGLAILDKTGVFKLPYPYYFLSIALSSIVTVFVSLFTKTAAGDDLPEQLKPIFNRL